MGNLVVGIVLICMVVLVIRSMIKNRKNKPQCGCGCGGCNKQCH